MSTVLTTTRGPILIVTINRPHVRNAVDAPTALLLHNAFTAFDADPSLRVAVLTGAGDYFCAGADLKAMLEPGGKRKNPLNEDMDAIAPMGPTRLQLSKPVIAAIAGPCVAGGLELACWCDLRVCSPSATFGVLCRLRGVPLIDGGTVRLPALIGLSHASDLILTGRVVGAVEAKAMGLVNRVSEGDVVEGAVKLAEVLAGHPQECMRNDRGSMVRSAFGSRGVREDLKYEFEVGMRSLQSAEFGGAIKEFLGKKARL
ncbi:Enoyl-CoA hydratase [Irineochytrium annulatum]|nr:Enoyl-CoA hydratase [Irineochytrium annulatum]